MPSNPSSCFPGFPPNLSNIGFHAPPQHPGWDMMGPRATLAIAALLDFHFEWTSPFRTLPCGIAKLLRKTRTPTRFGGGHCTISGSIRPQHRRQATANIAFFKTGAPVAVESGSFHVRRDADADAYCNGDADCDATARRRRLPLRGPLQPRDQIRRQGLVPLLCRARSTSQR